MNEQPLPENPYASPSDPTGDSESLRQASWTEDSVTFSFQQSVEDYEAAQDFLSKRQSTTTLKVKPTFRFAIIMVTMILVFLLMSVLSSPIVSGWIVVGGFAMLTAVFVAVLLLLVFGRLSNGIAKLTSSDPEEFLCQVQFTIGPGGVRTMTPNTEVLRRWASFEELAETDQHLFLVRKSLILNWIPKRAFAGLAETTQVVQLIQSYLKPIEK